MPSVRIGLALEAILLSVLSLPVRANPPAMIHQMGWLAGKTWSARVEKMPGRVSHIDVRYDWSATGNFVQFTTKFVENGGGAKRRYAGNFYFDPATGGLAMWYMNQDNVIIKGPVQIQGNRMTMTFAEGPTAYRATVTRTNATLYRWVLFQRVGKDWKQLLVLDYARIG